MYSVFSDINDINPKLVEQTFSECSEYAKQLLARDISLDVIFIFSKADEEIGQLKKDLAGMVSRKQVMEFQSKHPIHYEIVYRTVFDHNNSAFCHAASIFFVCEKLKQFHNRILSVQPVTKDEFYKQLDERLPF